MFSPRPAPGGDAVRLPDPVQIEGARRGSVRGLPTPRQARSDERGALRLSRRLLTDWCRASPNQHSGSMWVRWCRATWARRGILSVPARLGEASWTARRSGTSAMVATSTRRLASPFRRITATRLRRFPDAPRPSRPDHPTDVDRHHHRRARLERQAGSGLAWPSLPRLHDGDIRPSPR